MRHCVQCDTCREVHRFGTPVERATWATGHLRESGHRPRAYDELDSGLVIPGVPGPDEIVIVERQR